MEIEWKLDIGNVIAIVTLLGGAGWALFRRFDTLFAAVKDLSEKVDSVEKGLEAAAATANGIRQEVNHLSHRVTRLDTLIEITIPGTITDPATRAVARDIARGREVGSP